MITIVNKSRDIGGAWRIQVALDDGSIFLKFATEPSDARIMGEAQKYQDARSVPAKQIERENDRRRATDVQRPMEDAP